MQKHRLVLGPLAFLVLVLAGCEQPAPQTAPTPAQGEDQAPLKAEAKPVMAGPISIEPDSLASCDVGAEVTVHWDVSAEHPQVTETEVWTGSATRELTLFAASGPSGEAKTGPWTGPGSIFAVKDRATGEELARVVVNGPRCE